LNLFCKPKTCEYEITKSVLNQRNINKIIHDISNIFFILKNVRFVNLNFLTYIRFMKIKFLLILLLISGLGKSQSQTRFGPSVGVFKNPDIKSLAVGFQVRREYLKKKDSTNQTNKSLLYNQLEIQIVDGIDYYQMKVPVVMGFNIFNLRPNLGIEVRSNLVFTGPSYLGLNRLQYDLEDKNGIYPVL